MVNNRQCVPASQRMAHPAPTSTGVPGAARAGSRGQLGPSAVEGIAAGVDGPEELSKHLVSPAPSPGPRAPPSTLHQTLCLERQKNHNYKVPQ